jgi:hypothetical protein
VDWASLLVAGEYRNAEVRYFFLPLVDFPKLPRYGLRSRCVSTSSYLTFMFHQNRLFRLSLRFVNDAGCANHRDLFQEFADLYGIDAARQNAFTLRGKKVTLHVGNYPRDHYPWDASLYGTLVEFAKTGAPSYAGQPW